MRQRPGGMRKLWVVLLVLCGLPVSAATANATVYTYIGNPLTLESESNCPNDCDLTGGVITMSAEFDPIDKFWFGRVGVAFNAEFFSEVIGIDGFTLDKLGNVTNWSVNLQLGGGSGYVVIGSSPGGDSVQIFACLDFACSDTESGFGFAGPGHWSPTFATPLPASAH
jgi:hypothetical protein